jgi:hypothetical protein
MLLEHIIEILNNNSGAATALLTFGLLIATAALVYVSWVLSKETRLMRKIQTDPKIDIYVDTKNDFPVFMLFIKNHGNGTAKNIKFEISYKYQNNQDDDSPILVELKKAIKDVVLLDKGIISMPPQKEYKAYLISALVDFEELNKILINIKVTYQDEHNNNYSGNHLLSFSHFKGTSTDEGHVRAIRNYIENISKHIEKISSGSGEIYVVTKTIKEKKIENEERYKRYKKNFENNDNR